MTGRLLFISIYLIYSNLSIDLNKCCTSSHRWIVVEGNVLNLMCCCWPDHLLAAFPSALVTCCYPSHELKLFETSNPPGTLQLHWAETWRSLEPICPRWQLQHTLRGSINALMRQLSIRNYNLKSDNETLSSPGPQVSSG